jgi:hypothetical protein
MPPQRKQTQRAYPTRHHSATARRNQNGTARYLNGVIGRHLASVAVLRDAKGGLELLRFHGAVEDCSVSENDPHRHHTSRHSCGLPDVDDVFCEEGPEDRTEDRDITGEDITLDGGVLSDDDGDALAEDRPTLDLSVDDEIFAYRNLTSHSKSRLHDRDSRILAHSRLMRATGLS